MDREMCQIEIMMNAFAVDPLKLPPLLTAHCPLFTAHGTVVAVMC